jgi:hypothetical protein
VLSGCGAMRNDMEIGLKNLGSFSENEPNLRGILRSLKSISLGSVDFFGSGFGWLFGLMLLNQTTNVHLSAGEEGSRMVIH